LPGTSSLDSVSVEDVVLGVAGLFGKAKRKLLGKEMESGLSYVASGSVGLTAVAETSSSATVGGIDPALWEPQELGEQLTSHDLFLTCRQFVTKIRLMKVLVWFVATYGCESWTLRKNGETRFDAFEMKGLRNILQVSWTAKKTNEWVLNKAGVKRELLDTVKASKLVYYGHTMRKQRSCLEHTGHEDHAQPGWTTSRRGQDSPWKRQSE